MTPVTFVPRTEWQAFFIARKQDLNGLGVMAAIHFPARHFLQDVARRAERKINESGRIPGIRKHAYAARLVERYQRRHGPIGQGLSTEQSYLEGMYLGRAVNLKGSV